MAILDKQMAPPKGRKPKPLPWHRIDEFILCGLSGRDIAKRVGYSPNTIYAGCLRDKGVPFFNYTQQVAKRVWRSDFIWDVQEVRGILSTYYHEYIDLSTAQKREWDTTDHVWGALSKGEVTGTRAIRCKPISIPSTGKTLGEQLGWNDLDQIMRQMNGEIVCVNGQMIQGWWGHVFRAWVSKVEKSERQMPRVTPEDLKDALTMLGHKLSQLLL